MYKKLSIPAFLILLILGAFYALGQDTVTQEISHSTDSIEFYSDSNENANIALVTNESVLY